MAAKEEPTVPQLFSEVHRFFRNGEYNKAQKSANRILRQLPNDEDAIKCKIACLVQQSNFQEGLDAISAASKKGIVELPFEKAYCLYRLNRLEEAEKVLNSVEEKSFKEKELLAQVQYKLENYKSSHELYKDLIRHSQDDCGDEREANMLAVVAASKMWENNDLVDVPARPDTHELCYNYACILMAKGNLEAAREKLLEAEALCRKSFEADEDCTEEDIEEELGVIKVQLAYIKQLQGSTGEALKAYNQILKTKPADIALTAVLSNNIIAIHKSKDLFDSKKRLKALNVPGLENKLTRFQQQCMEVNKCLLNMFMNQIDACKKSLKKLKTQFPDQNLASNKTAILEAAVHLRDKHAEQALDHLKQMVTSGVESDDLRLTLAQLLLTKGKVQDALTYLESVSINIKYSPALVSLIVTLHNNSGNREKAQRLLDDAVAFGEQNRTKMKKETLVTLIRENASAKLVSGKMQESIDMLEKLRREDPDDITTLAKIVAAYSKINLAKAEEFSNSLPEFSVESNTVDVNALEMVDMIGSFRFSKKAQNKEEEKPGDAREDVKLKKKKKKKRKGKLPKNYNPEVDPDPERWLPRWERSTFKHKKQKRGAQPSVGKGTQGAVASESVASPKANSVSSPKPAATTPKAGATTSPTPNSPKAGESTSVVPPRQQKPQAAKSKQKKKKKGSGW